MISNMASPAFMDSLLPQPFAAADIEDRYSYKQPRCRQENDVEHERLSPYRNLEFDKYSQVDSVSISLEVLEPVFASDLQGGAPSEEWHVRVKEVAMKS
jgi:hypothetical protein